MATGVSQAIIDRQKWLDDISDKLQPLINDTFSSGGEVGKIAKDFLNGVWLGHPLHPVITDVPVGAWTMTQLLDLISLMRGDDAGLDAAADITLGAGIVAALGAAVTGLADWSDVGGSHRRMGMAHALLNMGGLTLNVASLALRAGGKKNRGVARSLSAGGYVLNAAAAYVAGELVYNLGQAVNRDAWVDGPNKFTDVASLEELREGEMVKVDYDGRPIVLLQHDDGIHAFEGTCPHYGCGLWEGKLEDHTLTCQCHGSQFDVRDGSLLHGPATAPVPSYDVRRRMGRVQIRMRK
ncbi:MAG: non-heme iron oxygenase ferredoxin subunit [Chloroflexota bacterium]|nr:non-heme iron oxygenase ferredoxin subunit [Chloroflexota bacterium]MDQ5866741.1 non-heme iron oxygenase ferredoxin subunit [Chloroflexota bacterium]